MHPFLLVHCKHRGNLEMVLYLQDILIECSAPEKFQKPTNSDESDILIVDFGSWQCRAGLSNEAEPSRKNKEIK